MRSNFLLIATLVGCLSATAAWADGFSGVVRIGPHSIKQVEFDLTSPGSCFLNKNGEVAARKTFKIVMADHLLTDFVESHVEGSGDSPENQAICQDAGAGSVDEMKQDLEALNEINDGDISKGCTSGGCTCETQVKDILVINDVAVDADSSIYVTNIVVPCP